MRIGIPPNYCPGPYTFDGGVWFGSKNGRQFRVEDTPNAVNYLRIGGTSAGTSLPIAAMGADAAININIAPKGSGILNIISNSIRILSSRTPVNANDNGAFGTVCWDADYIYVCVATNTWKRTPLTTW